MEKFIHTFDRLLTVNNILIAICFLIVIIIAVLIIPGIKAGLKPTKKSKYKFCLYHSKGVLEFYDPFDSFLIYAGANSGKTKSVGKPLLREYIRHHFAMFIYDYKDFDLTKTAYNLIKNEEYGYPYKFYYLNFVDPSKSYRCNPISPDIVTNYNVFMQLMVDMVLANISGAQDDWIKGAIGILKGVATRFYFDFPQFCTIPHIALYFGTIENQQELVEFLEARPESKSAAQAYLMAKGSEKTQASFLSTCGNFLSLLAENKEIIYVLSGNKEHSNYFEFNLIDPNNPKAVSVANAFQIESAISPIIALMVSMTSRAFTLKNQIPFCYFLDEATTFRIPDFEKLPSVLREYLCSFVFITQSGAKVERRYNKLDKSSIEANLGNQFYGRTRDTEALKNYPIIFGKYEKEKVSHTYGQSRGNDSRSISKSTQKEDVFESSVFTNLQSGEFIGVAPHSNVSRFKYRFNMFDQSEELPLPEVEFVSKTEIEYNYQRILSELASIKLDNTE